MGEWDGVAGRKALPSKRIPPPLPTGWHRGGRHAAGGREGEEGISSVYPINTDG